MKPYPAYKATGTTWLGEVPEHWDVKMLKHLGRFKAGAGFPIEHQGMPGEELPFFKVKDIETSTDRCWMTESESTVSVEIAKNLGANIFPRETIVFAKVGAALLLNRFRLLGLSSCIDNNMMGFSITENSVLPRFMWSAMQRINFREFANPGPVPSLNETQVSNLYFALPSYGEQQAIVTYLDRETARIDTLLAEKGRLIDTLREYRQATISEVVTQGLDSAAPKKPSGVPWLGDVPAHWGLKRLKFHVEQVGEKTSEPLAGVVYIGLEHIESGTGKFIASIDGTQTESESTVNHFRVGDVLFGKLRPYLAKVVIAYGEGVCTTELLVLRPHSMDSGYLLRCLLLDGFIKTVDASTFGAKMPRADWTFISNLLLPEPPVVEQQAIAAYLDRETARIDKLIGHVQDEIKLLQELRAATITDAVTGKIQVS